MADEKAIQGMVDHLFRHEAGKMVAVLTRIFGFNNIELAEDIVQETMLKALTVWKYGKLPENPQAWLYRTAKNKAIDVLRREKNFREISHELSQLLQSEYTLSYTLNNLFLENEIQDSQLRMIFACCHPALVLEVQVTLTLKTLCGLSVREISNAFLTSEETIGKRLYRAKEKIRSEKIVLAVPEGIHLAQRLDAVLKTIYLLFNEGYNSSHPEKLIKKELCEEAMRLCLLLTEHPLTQVPKTNALLALMCLHASRFDSRIDDQGCIILLKEQDRNTWNKTLINIGVEYLEKSAMGDELSEYHLEAAIAACYALAPKHEATDWKQVLYYYGLLLVLKDTPVVRLNRAIALAQIAGPEKAVAEIHKITGMEQHYLYQATLGEMHMLLGARSEAEACFSKALNFTQSKAEIELIKKKLNML